MFHPSVSVPPSRPAIEEYLATTGAGVLDAGGPLVPFVDGLVNTFGQLADEDIAVWRVDGEGNARLAAVLTPGVGGTAVKWV